MALSEILSATEVKRNFLALLKQLDREHGAITITRNGVAAGVLMSVDEYESLTETLEILADPKLVRALGRARGRLQRRRALNHEQVWSDE
jgi:prevent-host-death family protein